MADNHLSQQEKTSAMTQRFVVINQHGHYYSKQKSWTDGSDPARVYSPKHHDEALNTLLEINAKDIELRGEVMAVDLNERDLPILEVSDIPLPEPEPEPQLELDPEAEPETTEASEPKLAQSTDQPA